MKKILVTERLHGEIVTHLEEDDSPAGSNIASRDYVRTSRLLTMREIMEYRDYTNANKETLARKKDLTKITVEFE